MLSTLHTIDSPETINRIVDFFPPYQQTQVRVAAGRIDQGDDLPATRADCATARAAWPALEVMVANGRIQQCITDPHKGGDIHEIVADGEYYGMQTFDQALVKLFEQGLIDLRAAMAAATNPHDLKVMLQHAGLVGRLLAGPQRGTGVTSVTCRRRQDAAVGNVGRR